MPLAHLATIAEVSLWELPGQWWHILYFIVGPLLLLMGIGYLIQRTLTLDMPTMARLNFYFVIPGVIYSAVVQATVSLGDVAVVMGFHILLITVLVTLTVLCAMIWRVKRDRIMAMLMAVMYYNSGNYGLPLQGLAFRSTSEVASSSAMGLQVFVMILQNFSGFTIGVLMAAAGGSKDRHWKQNLLHIAKFPPVYALVAGLITVQVRKMLGDHAGAAADAFQPFWDVVMYLRGAFIAVALATLGAQLALVKARDGEKYPVKLTVVLRLCVAPLVALGLIYAAYYLLPGVISPFVGQVLLISAATPTAVNSMLLCLEFDNHPDYLARSVFYSTLLSPLTVTLVIFLAQSGFLTPLVIPS